jgi:hypothetical protein
MQTPNHNLTLDERASCLGEYFEMHVQIHEICAKVLAASRGLSVIGFCLSDCTTGWRKIEHYPHIDGRPMLFLMRLMFTK